MRYEKFQMNTLFPQLKKGETGFEAHLTAYLPDNSPEIDTNYKRPTILVCPGGGYGFTSDREAEPIALSYVGENYNAFVLRYSIAPARYPQQILEVSAALAFIRRNAEVFHVDTDAITVCGFSAGGHLTASIGAFWDEDFIKETLEIKQDENKPNGLILAYPVITAGEFAHRGSFDNLLGENASEEMLDKMSIEKQVTDKMPPAFIWHTFNDNAVPIQNSIFLADAMAKQGIPFELHIYPDGCHGLSTCNETTGVINRHVESWMGLSKKWLKLTFGK